MRQDHVRTDGSSVIYPDLSVKRYVEYDNYDYPYLVI